MSTLILVVVGGLQAAFIVALLVVLVAMHRQGRRDIAVESAAEAELRAPVRKLLLGEDRGESLAAALGRLAPDAATRQLLTISAAQLGPEQLQDLAIRVRPADWVQRRLEGGTSKHWWRRMEAARILSVVSSPSDMPLITRLVSDPHPAVAIAATGAIAHHADARLIETIIRGLSDQSPAVRLQQMRALRTHGDIATPMVVAQLGESGSPARLRSLVQLAEILGTSAALAAIVPLASHDKADIRATVARALRSCFMASGVQAARRLLTDEDWQVRAAAARALAGLHDVQSIPALQTALSDESWWVRFRAALALGGLGANGTSALEASAKSDDAFARDMATVVLALSEPARLELSA